MALLSRRSLWAAVSIQAVRSPQLHIVPTFTQTTGRLSHPSEPDIHTKGFALLMDLTHWASDMAVPMSIAHSLSGFPQVPGVSSRGKLLKEIKKKLGLSSFHVKLFKNSID